MRAVTPLERESQVRQLLDIRERIAVIDAQMNARDIPTETAKTQSDRPKPGLSEHQKAAAHARHAENYQLKETVLAYYAEHKSEYKNMTDAATKIAGKIVPMPMRTVYGWIREWEKIQSAG